MKMKQKSLKSNLNRLAIIPLLSLGLTVLIITTFSIYNALSYETKDGLGNLAHSLYSSCEREGIGDFSYNDGVFTRGGVPFNESFSLVDDVKKVSGVDATIFYESTRAITSILNEDGSRAVGTRPSPTVIQTVLNDGKDYFSENVFVNGIPYFGYYTPLYNTDSSITGMVFVGKPRDTVVGIVFDTVFLIFIVTVVVIAISLFAALLYAKKIIYSLSKTKEFLHSMAQGDSSSEFDPCLLSRRDEIGEMGRCAVVLQEAITELIGTDSLTGLNNRRSCTTILDNTIREFNNYQVPFVLAIGDIDWFKNINDKFGHTAGDVVLQEISHIFMEHMKNKGFVSRWGGEEFLFIYERVTMKKAVFYLEDLMYLIRTANITYNGKVIPVTMTFGVEEFNQEMDAKTIVELADNNLYYGKFNGRNQIVSVHPEE